jgi:hypothetical protein
MYWGSGFRAHPDRHGKVYRKSSHCRFRVYLVIETPITTTHFWGSQKAQNNVTQAPYRTCGEPSQQAVLAARAATQTTKIAIQVRFSNTNFWAFCRRGTVFFFFFFFVKY